MQFKTYFRKIYLTFFFIILFLTNAISLENKIVFKIENEIITNLDIDNERKYLEALNPDIKDLGENRINSIAKNSLIKEKIKKNEILKFTKQINLDPKFLERLIRDRYSRLNLNNKNEFLNYIKSFEIDINTIEDKISIEALWNQLIYKKFLNNVKINEKKLKQQIEESYNLGEKSYLLSEIIFIVKEKDNFDAKYKQINEIIINNGFENAALTYSVSDSAEVGGKLGWIKESSLNNKIKLSLSEINKNDISKPIFTPNGYLILKIEDIKFIKADFDKEKEFKNLVRIKTNQQLNQYSNIYFNKVKKNTIINEF